MLWDGQLTLHSHGSTQVWSIFCVISSSRDETYLAILLTTQTYDVISAWT